MSRPVVLFLDDNPARHQVFLHSRQDALIQWAKTAREAVELLGSSIVFDEISLDHDLCEEDQNKQDGFIEPTGYLVAEYLATHPEVSSNASIRLHSFNNWGVQAMRRVLSGAGRDCFVKPFHWREG